MLAAFLFALAAALQQKGAIGLLEISLRHPASLARHRAVGPPLSISQ
jgi:hypothetical protein